MWSKGIALEAACWVTGILLVALFFGARIGGEFERKQGIEDFAQARAIANPEAENLVFDRKVAIELAADFPASALIPMSYEQPVPESRKVLEAADSRSLPIALLRIARVGLEVPVYADTSERNLNRGAGWVEGTAAPNTDGNMAIAAHRDGHFRILKDVAVGDVLEIQSLSSERAYRITEISIVEPEEVSVLDATAEATVTLVTCYPFYFIGNAPQRYIVQAVSVN